MYWQSQPRHDSIRLPRSIRFIPGPINHHLTFILDLLALHHRHHRRQSVPVRIRTNPTRYQTGTTRSCTTRNRSSMSLIYTAPSAPGSGMKEHGLYIGGKKDAKSRSSLDRWGVSHVLNVTTEKDSSVQVSYAWVKIMLTFPVIVARAAKYSQSSSLSRKINLIFLWLLHALYALQHYRYVCLSRSLCHLSLLVTFKNENMYD